MKKIIVIFLVFLLFSCGNINEINKFDKISTLSDIDRDGINDIDDILEGARKEIKNKTIYKSAYYSGGYPPKNEGVCTDVIWRAFKNMGFDLKKNLDKDIKNNLSDYSNIKGKPDRNIDFRRVPNLNVFFKKYAISLDKKLDIKNIKSLKSWQGGDIIVFSKPNQHIAIVSDRRDKNGVPFLIHNYSDFPKEDNWIFYTDMKKFPIIGHYRIKYGKGIWK